MNAPCGLAGAIQFAVLKADTVLATNSTITTSFTATRKPLKRAVSRTPATRIAVIRIITVAAGRSRTAPVNVQACVAASNANRGGTNPAGSTSPTAFRRLPPYPDQPSATAPAPCALSVSKSAGDVGAHVSAMVKRFTMTGVVRRVRECSAGIRLRRAAEPHLGQVSAVLPTFFRGEFRAAGFFQCRQIGLHQLPQDGCGGALGLVARYVAPPRNFFPTAFRVSRLPIIPQMATRPGNYLHPTPAQPFPH